MKNEESPLCSKLFVVKKEKPVRFPHRDYMHCFCYHTHTTVLLSHFAMFLSATHFNVDSPSYALENGKGTKQHSCEIKMCMERKNIKNLFIANDGNALIADN